MIKGEQSPISLIRNFLKLIPHTNSYTILLLHKIALCPIVAAIYNTFFILTRIFPDRLFCDWFYFLANKSTLLGLDFFFFLHSKFLFWLSVSLLEINCRVLFCFVFFPCSALNITFLPSSNFLISHFQVPAFYNQLYQHWLV